VLKKVNYHAETYSFFRDSSIAVIGAGGSVGREVVSQLLQLQIGKLLAYDNDENALFELENLHQSDPRFAARFCDIVTLDRYARMLDGVDFVFHAAALKHILVCEHSPLAAVAVNIVGLSNLIDAAMNARVKRVLFTSSDKAVNPTSVMGGSKFVGERIVAANDKRNGVTLTSCTRFGNVAGSRGSVIPLFYHQIVSGQHITLTDPGMTRFFMTLRDAASLTIQSMVHACGGETFITKMQTIRIRDLAQAMVNVVAPAVGRPIASVSINVVGRRPGEKLYEELTTDEESCRTLDVGPYLVIQPLQALRNNSPLSVYQQLGPAERSTRAYRSQDETPMSIEAIEDFLRDNNLVPCLRPAPSWREKEKAA
jgi:FlaA1/EpsC-like NDP-sugar epimerase